MYARSSLMISASVTLRSLVAWPPRPVVAVIGRSSGERRRLVQQNVCPTQRARRRGRCTLEEGLVPELRRQNRDERLVLCESGRPTGLAAPQQAGHTRGLENPHASDRRGLKQLADVVRTVRAEERRGVGGA